MTLLRITASSCRLDRCRASSIRRLSSFTGNLGGSQRTYASEISYSPFGGMTQEQFGMQTPLYHKKHYNVRGQLYDVRVSTLSLAQNEFDWNRGCLAFYYGGAGWGQSSTANNGNVTAQQHWVPANESYSDYAYTQQSYNYDSLNRLKSMSEQPGTPAGLGAPVFVQAYNYDRWGNRTIDNDATWGTGINNKQFTVDPNNNRLGVPSGQSGAMSYDNAGNLTADTYSGAAVTRIYDAENKMTKETQAGGADAGIYSYDGDGRRVKRKIGTTETWQVYGIGGELLAEYTSNGTQLSKEYGYRNGELLITATVASGWGAAPTIDDNPLKNPENPESFKIKAVHITQLRDAINALRSHHNLPNHVWQKPAASNGAINNTVSVSWEPIDEMRTALNEALGPPSPEYAGGLAFGQPILADHIQELRNRVLNAWQSGGGGVDIRWLVTDQLGTPRMVFDQSGSLANVSRHDYLPFGEEMPANFRTGIPGYGASDNVRQKFTSKERDNETGLDYFKARYYSSSQGRFTSPDAPFADQRQTDPSSWNLYAYVRNNPCTNIDPNGRCSQPSGMTQGTIGICIEAFIAARKVSIARGDNRGFSGDDASLTTRVRVEILIKQEKSGRSIQEFTYPEVSTVDIPTPSGISIPLSAPGEAKTDISDIETNKEGTTTFTSTTTATNGFKDVPVVGKALGPIETKLNWVVTKDDQVGLAAGSDRKNYPSYGIYVYRYDKDGKVITTKIQELPEGRLRDLNRPKVPIPPVAPR